MEDIQCIKSCAEHDYVFEGHHIYFTWYIEDELSFEQWLGRIDKLEGEDNRTATIYFYADKTTEVKPLYAELYLSHNDLFRREEASWRLAEGPPSRAIPKVIEDPSTGGGYSAACVTSEAMARFVEGVGAEGLELVDVGADGNNCALLCILSEVKPGEVARSGKGAATRAAIKRYRGLVADAHEARFQAELQLPPELLLAGGELCIADAIISLQAGEGDTPDRHSAAGAELLLRHCEALRGSAQLTHVDIQALVQVLSEQEGNHVSIECWTPGPGGGIVKTNIAAAAAAAGSCRQIVLANVWFNWMAGRRGARRAGAAGALDHFMLVRPAAAAAAGTPGKRRRVAPGSA